MKSFKPLLVLLFVTIVAILSSCGDDSTSPTPEAVTYEFKCTLNGGGYNNLAINYNSGAGSVYSPTEDETGISFGGVNDMGVIAFKGKSTGTFSISETNQLYITVGGVANTISMETGTITVSSYGAVNSSVKGTFSGTGIKASTGQTVTISNGSFTARRVN
jgi:hypothetical protein